MSYTSYDFTESLDRVSIPIFDVARVLAAHGQGQWAEWDGGFLMEMTDGRFAYLSGWCDSSGWGCQDGADVAYFDVAPSLTELATDVDWDTEPADLNRALVA